MSRILTSFGKHLVECIPNIVDMTRNDQPEFCSSNLKFQWKLKVNSSKNQNVKTPTTDNNTKISCKHQNIHLHSENHKFLKFLFDFPISLLHSSLVSTETRLPYRFTLIVEFCTFTSISYPAALGRALRRKKQIKHWKNTLLLNRRRKGKKKKKV